MCGRLFFLVSLVLLLCMVGTASAVEVKVDFGAGSVVPEWTPPDTPGVDNSWRTPENRDTDVVLGPADSMASAVEFRFTVAGDCLPGDNPEYGAAWRQTLEQITKNVIDEGAFFVLPGDIEWPDIVYDDLKNEFGDDIIYYPVVGNHEGDMMQWLRDYYTDKLEPTVNRGPINGEETTYSWDYQNAHFVVLNEYYDGEDDFGTDGDIVDELYDWLVNDLDNTTKPAIFVFGHEPAYPVRRHIGDSLDQYPSHRDRFWKLLNDRKVMAFLCGHTHCYSRIQVDDSNSPLSGDVFAWQIDTAATSTGSGDRKATFFDITVTDTNVQFDVWRGDKDDIYRDFVM
ncbi:MAG: metallophosphoesterase family protein, partial [Planctomycetota bacterium]